MTLMIRLKQAGTFSQRFLGMCLLAVLLAACSSGGSPETVYHTLGTVAVDNSDDNLEPVRLRKPIKSVGIGPVYMPTLLNRQGVVLRKDRYTVEVSDFHQWGGELDDEFLGVLAQHLQERLPATTVLIIPWELEQTPQYQLTVRVAQFDGTPGQQAVLKGRWQLQWAKTGKGIRSAQFILRRKPVDDSVTALIRAQGQLVDALALEILQGL